MTAIFAGSFDPFTTGHADIVKRALCCFGRIVIAVGVNERKRTMLTAEERVRAIRALYNGDSRVEVEQYSCLTVDFAARYSNAVLIKGIRSVKDFEYEREQAELNRRIGGVETLFFPADPQLECVSSSAVRELIHFGKDVAELLPKAP